MNLTVELPDELEGPLKQRAQACGVSTEQYASQVIENGLEPDTPRRHISEVIRERMRSVPPEVWATLPADGASEHDHYIYGLPKRNP